MTTRKKTPVDECKDESGSARKMAVSLLTRLTNQERTVKAILRSISGEEQLARDPDLPPKSTNETLAEALRVSERVTRTTKLLSERLGVGE